MFLKCVKMRGTETFNVDREKVTIIKLLLVAATGERSSGDDATYVGCYWYTDGGLKFALHRIH